LRRLSSLNFLHQIGERGSFARRTEEIKGRGEGNDGITEFSKLTELGKEGGQENMKKPGSRTQFSNFPNSLRAGLQQSEKMSALKIILISWV
jgi:hypothetical protein